MAVITVNFIFIYGFHSYNLLIQGVQAEGEISPNKKEDASLFCPFPAAGGLQRVMVGLVLLLRTQGGELLRHDMDDCAVGVDTLLQHQRDELLLKEWL